jgi:hypothetical protein
MRMKIKRREVEVKRSEERKDDVDNKAKLLSFCIVSVSDDVCLKGLIISSIPHPPPPYISYLF